MKVRRIITEDANAEQWRMLLHFSYEPNIRRFLETRGHAPSDQLAEFIAGSLRQGQAYFMAAQSAPLDISPLLLYYGLTNLMVGVAALTTGTRPSIRSHGMTLQDPQATRDTEEVPVRSGGDNLQARDPSSASTESIEDAEHKTVAPQDHVPVGLAALRVAPHSPHNGALNVLANVFSPGMTLRMNQPWTLEELFGSVPDLRDEFMACYPNAACYIMPLELVRRRHATFERVDLKHIQSFARLFPEVDRIETFLMMIEGFEEAYLVPQRARGFVPLRRKLKGRDIGVYGMFGRKFLAFPHIIDHNSNGVTTPDKLHTPSPLITLLMSLFALGFVSRYQPEVWNPFVRNDTTGEKMVVERLLFIASRYAPNLVLNVIHNERLSFVPPSQDLGETLEEHSLTALGIRDDREVVGNHAPLLWSENELKNWVKDAVQDMLRRMQRG